MADWSLFYVLQVNRVHVVFCSAEVWWASLEPDDLMSVILVFKNAMAYMLKTGLLHTNNLGIKYLLKVLKLVYKVSIHLHHSLYSCISETYCVIQLLSY